jgi:two-component system cell cycle response regulator CpdR
MPDTGRSTPGPSAAPDASSDGVPGRAILVVDDEPSVRRYIADVLRNRGHEVVVAGGGREALRAVYERSTTPALLVSDIGMPDMSGIELAARLSADRPGIRVILMTGTPASAELARERAELVSAVLLKPFTLDDLLRAVEAALADAPGQPPDSPA